MSTRSNTTRRSGWMLIVLGCAGIAVTVGGCRKRRALDPVAKVEAHPSTRLIHFAGQTGIEMEEESFKLAGVTSVVAGKEDLHETLQLTGEAAATESGTVQVTSRLPGRIVEALVSVGTLVRKGQLIAQVDSVDLTQAVTTYRTAVAHSQLMRHQLEQQRRLAQYGTISEPPIEDARRAFAAVQAAVASDEAQIKIDKVALENTRQLVDMGEITHKPLEDAQNAHALAVAALSQSKTQLNSARQNRTRVKTLYEAGIYSKQQLEDSETAYNAAVASVDQNVTQEKVTAEEMRRQEHIYQRNLNGAFSLQQAQSKLQQDEHTYQNDLTALELARRQLERAQTVKKSRIPTSQALQQAEDAYEEAKAAVEAAKNTLRLYGVSPAQGIAQLQTGHAVIPVVSPIKGIVTARNMVVGQMTDTSTPLVKVVNLDSVYVDAQVYEKDLAQVSFGDAVQVRVAAYPQKLFAGRVKYIGNEVSPDTRTIMVRTVLANPGWLLRPSMYATVLLGRRAAQRTISIPTDAVMQVGGQQVVYVQVAPLQFVKRPVKTGAAQGGKAPVYSGLQPGEKVVVAGNVLMQHEQEKLESEKRGPA